MTGEPSHEQCKDDPKTAQQQKFYSGNDPRAVGGIPLLFPQKKTHEHDGDRCMGGAGNGGGNPAQRSPTGSMGPQSKDPSQKGQQEATTSAGRSATRHGGQIGGVR